MSSPTIDELTSPINFAEDAVKDGACSKLADSSSALNSSPIAEEKKDLNSPKYGPTPSPAKTRFTSDCEQSDTPLKKRPCRKAKTEAFDRSLAQSYRSPTKRKPRARSHEDVNDKKNDKSVKLNRTLDTIPIKGEVTQDTVTQIDSAEVKHPPETQSPKQRYVRSKGKRSRKKPTKTQVSALEDKDDILSSRSVLRDTNGAHDNDSQTSNEDTLTSTPVETKLPRKRRVLDTSWFDEDPILSLPSIPSDIPSGSLNRDSEEDCLSALSGSQQTYSGASSGNDSDDDDLPDMLSTSVSNEAVDVGDLIWLKYGSYPFWPAIVKNTYKVKKRRLQKITVAFIGDIGSSIGHQFLRVSYRKQNVFPFASCGHDKHHAFKNDGENSPYKDQFRIAFDAAEYYIFKTAQKSINIFEHFASLFKSKNVHVATSSASSTVSAVEESMQDKTLDAVQPPGTPESADTSEQPETRPSLELSIATQQKIQRRTNQNQRLVDFIKEARCKNHVSDIFHGQVPSERHNLFFQPTKTKAEQNMLKYSGFGPIADETQREEVIDILKEYAKDWTEKGQQLQVLDYVLNVLVAEAIIFAIQSVLHKSRSVAEQQFYKGAKYFKEEQQQLERQFDRHLSTESPAVSSEYDSDE